MSWLLKYPSAAAGTTGNVYASGEDVFIRIGWSTGVYTDLAFTDFAMVGVSFYPETGKRVWTPAAADTLVAWNGVSDIPRSDGSTGTAVEDIPTSPDNGAWWEQGINALTGGITGVRDWVQQVWERLGDISTTLTDVWEWCQALPQTMVTALADAVVPTVSVQTRVDDTTDEMGTRAPFAWPVVIFAVMGDLFEGGEACPEIVIPAGDMPGDYWANETMHFCVPEGGQTILYALCDVVAAGLVIVWAYWVYRRLLGS
jgi:hypothetical protein